MKRTFLYQVWQYNRKLFYILMAFIILTVFGNFMGDEITPFFVWGMYSEKEQPVQEYQVLRTTINDSTVLNVYDYATTDTRFYLFGPLNYYKRITDNRHLDPTISFLQTKLGKHYDQVRFLEPALFNTQLQQPEFLHWYARYIQQVTGTPVNTLHIDVVHTHYNENNLAVDSITPYATWEKP